MEIFDEISEYVGLFEDLQGNVNTEGLVFEDDVDETFGLDHEIYTIWVDQIDDGFGIAEDYNPYHHMEILEGFTILEVVGNIPLEVYHSNINVVHSREAAPVKVWWFGVNVVHGPDVFFEEVYSNLHERVTYTQAVPYYYEHIYESLDLIWENIQPHPGVHKALKLIATDFVNMRHELFQQYYFNNLSTEQFFTYDTAGIGWIHKIEDGFEINSSVMRYIGFAIVDYLFTQTDAFGHWKGSQVLTSNLFAYDRGEIIEGFTEAILEELTIADSAWGIFLESILESLDVADDLPGLVGKTSLLLSESIQVTEAAGIVAQAMLLIQEIIQGTDTPLAVFVRDYVEAVEDGFGLDVAAVANHILDKLIEDTFAGEDTPLVSWYISLLLDETFAIDEEIN